MSKSLVPVDQAKVALPARMRLDNEDNRHSEATTLRLSLLSPFVAKDASTGQVLYRIKNSTVSHSKRYLLVKQEGEESKQQQQHLAVMDMDGPFGKFYTYHPNAAKQTPERYATSRATAIDRSIFWD